MLNSSWLAPDPAVPQRDRLLDPLQMQHHMRVLYGGRRIEPPSTLRIKYRVGDSLRVLYRIPRSGADDVLVTVRTLSAGSRAAAVPGATNIVRGPAGWLQEARIPELSAAFWTFPVDRRLRHIEALLRPSQDLSKTFGGAWTRSELVGYAPGKSAVVACLGTASAPLGYAKVYASSVEASRAFDLHVDVWQGGSGRRGLRLPRPLSLDLSRHIVVTEAARGTRLTDLSPVHAARAVALLGAAIARFHATAIPSTAPRFRRSLPPSLRRAAALIGRARPELRAATADLASGLAESAPEDTGTVLLHGDLHLKNALIDGDALWLIDLDQVTRGAAAAEIGSFLALLRSRAVAALLPWNDLALLEREFIGAYGRVRPLPSKRVIDWHTSAALLGERALRAVSRVRVPMLRSLEALVDEAERTLRRGGN